MKLERASRKFLNGLPEPALNIEVSNLKLKARNYNGPRTKHNLEIGHTQICLALLMEARRQPNR